MTTTSVPLREHRNAFLRASEYIHFALDAHFWGYAAVFLLLFLACSITEDLRLKMWNDEIITLYVAQQGNPAEIAKATKEGMDATPPFYPIVVSAILPIVRPDALAVRLPSTLGFAGMVLFVLAFCRQRMPAVYAFIAATLAAVACGFYATEGRCYGMVLGCAAGALFYWQAATERKPRVLWLTLLALFLMLGTALHYYFIFMLVPLGLAEVSRWRAHKKADFAMLGAMLPALAVLAVHYPLIAAGSRYLSHFWAPGIASWSQVPDYYMQFSLVPGGVILVAFILRAMTSDLQGEQGSRKPALPRHEWVAIGTLPLMPVPMIAISKYTTHVFLTRYVLWGVIGVAIVSASVLWVSSRRQPIVGIAVLGVLVAIVGTQQLLGLRQSPMLRQGETVFRELQSVPDGQEPIVISYDHAFMELSYYAEPRIRQRLVYPLSRSLELRYNASDLDYLLLSAVRHRTKLHIMELDSFLQANPRFVLAAGPKDYLPQYLVATGYRLVPVRSETILLLYEVEAAQSQPAKAGRYTN